MDYSRWSSDYLFEAKKIFKHVSKLKKISKNSKKKNIDLERRIYVIYQIYLDLKHTSEYLKKCEERRKVENA